MKQYQMQENLGKVIILIEVSVRMLCSTTGAFVWFWRSPDLFKDMPPVARFVEVKWHTAHTIDWGLFAYAIAPWAAWVGGEIPHYKVQGHACYVLGDPSQCCWGLADAFYIVQTGPTAFYKIPKHQGCSCHFKSSVAVDAAAAKASQVAET